MHLFAPAKVNLGLRVIGRRSDGYHLLESVFAPIDLADELSIERQGGSGVRLRITGEGASGLPHGADNLVHRAAVGFLDRAGLREGLEVTVTKRIPAGAGLGGGSSDAGAVLRALDTLFPEALSPETLRRFALELGADVPFFLDPRPAWVEGVGERIRPFDRAPSLPLVLLHPGVPLATAEVFAAFAASRADSPSTSLTASEAGPTFDLTVLGQEARRRDPAALAGFLSNHLEVAATRLCPPIPRLRRLLAASGAQAVGMSGSGPTMYGVYEDGATAQQAQQSLQEAGRVWRVETVAAG